MRGEGGNGRDGPSVRHTPRQAIKAPAGRHYVNRLSKNTVAKPQTTLITPGVPVGDDMMGIREGRAIRHGERFTINGRTYQMHPNGTMFPVEGEGFIARVARGVIIALNAYARYNGICREAEHEIEMANVSDPDRVQAREIWRLRERYRDGEDADN